VGSAPFLREGSTNAPGQEEPGTRPARSALVIVAMLRLVTSRTRRWHRMVYVWLMVTRPPMVPSGSGPILPPTSEMPVARSWRRKALRRPKRKRCCGLRHVVTHW
jgi:hypothetical protein